MGLQDRLSQLPQVNPQKQRLVADLPAGVQLNAINQILAGQDTTNPQINTFVRQAAAGGLQPEQIRLKFIEEQKKSNNPLIILG